MGRSEMRWILAWVPLLALLATAPARADYEVPRLGSHGSWGVFADGSGTERQCWVATEAKRSVVVLDDKGGLRGGSKVLVLFTTGKDEFSMELRGADAPEGDSFINVGGVRMALFFQDGWGWLRDNSGDRRLKALMRKHRIGYVDLAGAAYEFTLDGFVPALEDARLLCRSPGS